MDGATHGREDIGDCAHDGVRAGCVEVATYGRDDFTDFQQSTVDWLALAGGGANGLSQACDRCRYRIEGCADISGQCRDRRSGGGVGQTSAASQCTHGGDSGADRRDRHADSTHNVGGIACEQTVTHVGDRTTDGFRQTGHGASRKRTTEPATTTGCTGWRDVAACGIGHVAHAGQYTTDCSCDRVAATGTCYLAAQAGDRATDFIEYAIQWGAQAGRCTDFSSYAFDHRDDGHQDFGSDSAREATQLPAGTFSAHGVANHGDGVADSTDQVARQRRNCGAYHWDSPQQRCHVLTGCGNTSPQVGHAGTDPGDSGAERIGVGAQGAHAAAHTIADTGYGSACAAYQATSRSAYHRDATNRGADTTYGSTNATQSGAQVACNLSGHQRCCGGTGSACSTRTAGTSPCAACTCSATCATASTTSPTCACGAAGATVRTAGPACACGAAGATIRAAGPACTCCTASAAISAAARTTRPGPSTCCCIRSRRCDATVMTATTATAASKAHCHDEGQRGTCFKHDLSFHE